MKNYADQIEDAIASNDVELLIKSAYGDTRRCRTIKGEPLCVCKMYAKVLRERIAPRALFQDRIERVGPKS